MFMEMFTSLCTIGLMMFWILFSILKKKWYILIWSIWHWGNSHIWVEVIETTSLTESHLKSLSTESNVLSLDVLELVRSRQPHSVWLVNMNFSTFGLCRTRRFRCPFCTWSVIVIKYSSTVCISIGSHVLVGSVQQPVRSLHRCRTVPRGMYTLDGSVVFT